MDGILGRARVPLGLVDRDAVSHVKQVLEVLEVDVYYQVPLFVGYHLGGHIDLLDGE